MSFYTRPPYDEEPNYYNDPPAQPTDWFATIGMAVLFAVGMAAIIWGAGGRLNLPFLP